MSRSPFDALAMEYDAARPSYPDGLYDALPPLRGTLVAEVGAGTGISTRGLLARGAEVVAFDLAPKMLERLRARGGDGLRGVAVADGHRLPLCDASVDLVTYAQAFHWLDAERAGAEAARVLRPGGALAVWWNNTDAEDEPWWRRHQEILEAANPSHRRDYRRNEMVSGLRAVFAELTITEVPWVRRVDVETYLTFLASKSYVAALGERLPAFLDAMRALLEETFPDGVVVEPFVTRLWVAR